MIRMRSNLLAGNRLHLSDGPIDLVIGADGEVACAFDAAHARFASILDELCAELPMLRRQTDRIPVGPTARRMWAATRAHDGFITPMAAVAGSVAEEILEAMTSAAKLDRAYVNNGGDIAFHLGEGRKYRIGLVDRPDNPSLFAGAVITSSDNVRGIATSGWRGRSFSLGIADAVTVLARSASIADAAATIIANAVDLPGNPAITRLPASDLQPDSDLGSRRVTRNVGPLTGAEIAEALDRGLGIAEDLRSRGLVQACALHLSGDTRCLERTPTSNRRLAAYA